MKKSIVIGLCLAMLAGVFADDLAAQATKPVVTPAKTPAKRVSCEGLGQDCHVQSAVQAWLRLVDSGDYRQSWIAASEVVRCRHDVCKWQKHLSEKRKCRGKVVSRELVDSEYCCEVPNMPEGQYSWVTYHTCFECGDPVCESVGVRCEADCACGGRWRVVHYSVK